MSASNAPVLGGLSEIEYAGKPGILLPPGMPQKGQRNTSVLRANGAAEFISHDTPLSAITPATNPMKRSIELQLGLASRALTGLSGTDPEIFVLESPKGRLIPAWEFLPDPQGANDLYDQEKNDPYGLGMNTPKAYWDGFQAEFSFSQGRHCHEYLTEGARHGLLKVLTAARAKFPDAVLAARDVVKVTDKDLLTADDVYVKLGCAPSKNAYGIPGIEIPNGRALDIRFSGCHLHFSRNCPIGWEIPTPPWFPDGTVVMMDKIGGLLLTALGRGLEDPLRRKFYGRPGEYRTPTAPTQAFRLEYRTPGSFLLRCPQAFIFAADMCRFGYRLGLLQDGREWGKIPDVKDIILNCDADAAVEVIERAWKPFFEKLIMTNAYGAGHVSDAQSIADATLTVLRYGIKGTLTHKSIEAAWNLIPNSYLPSNYRWAASAIQMAKSLTVKHSKDDDVDF